MSISIDDLIIDDSLQTRLNDPGTDDVIDTYTAALLKGDTFPPVTVIDVAGEGLVLVDGFHRVAATMMADRDTIDAVITKGTRRDAVLAAVGSNHAHGLRRTRAAKRQAVTMLLSDPQWVTWSDREIARRAGVTAPTVGKIRTELGADRTTRTYTRKGQQQVMQTGATAKPTTPPASAPKPAVAKLPAPGSVKAALADEPDDDDAPARDADEWFTPKWLVDLAREVMGEVTLDPFSCPLGQQVVKADTTYDKKQDGFKANWQGHRSLLNPPYSKMLKFSKKLMLTFGHVWVKQSSGQFFTSIPVDAEPPAGTEAIVITNTSAAAWAQMLIATCDVLFIPGKRLVFDEPVDGKRVRGSNPRYDNYVLYFGEQPQAFIDAFSARGTCFQRES